jgi:hypothetical protein
MRTPYIPHTYGPAARERAAATRGWLTTGVASSIPWPEEDVLVVYDGVEYLFGGVKQGGDHASPCLSTPCPRDNVDEALSRILRFASVLGWFKRGYVDIAGFVWGSVPIRYGNPRDVFTTTTQGGRLGFDCNHLPIIEGEQTRKALAFMREGRRLRHVHDAYAFLSFFKVIESQFRKDERVAWIQANLGALDGAAAKRVAELTALGIDVSRHLFASGRCAVAHASIDGEIVDPDIPGDRRRIRDDLDIIAALAQRYIAIDAGVPDEMSLLDSRDRLTPWHPLMSTEGLLRLHAGQVSESIADLGCIDGAALTVRFWGKEPLPELVGMTMVGVETSHGCVKLRANNQRGTIFLFFLMDVRHGQMHVLLEEGGVTDQFAAISETDVATYTHYFHSVIANGQVELLIDGVEPVDCEVIIPRNIIPRLPEEAVAEAVAAFRQRQHGDS